MPTLFHFTALAYLPAIRREGITMGEFPLHTMPYHQRPQWPNLTNFKNPKKHGAWNVSAFDKTRVRIEVDTSGLTIRSFDDLSSEYQLPERYLKALAPDGENRTWFHSMGAISANSFIGLEIALEQPFSYRSMREEHLTALCNHVEQHYIEHLTPSSIPGGSMTFNHPKTVDQCWLLDATQFVEKRTGKYRPLPKNWRKTV